MADFIATTTAVVIHPADVNFHYGEGVIEMRMVDEADGPFFELRQEEPGPIRVQLEELELLTEQARQMLAQPGVQADD